MFKLKLYNIIIESFQKDGVGSAKRLTGFAGWLSYLLCMFLSIHKDIDMPDCANVMLMYATMLLGLDTVTGAFGRKE